MLPLARVPEGDELTIRPDDSTWSTIRIRVLHTELPATEIRPLRVKTGLTSGLRQTFGPILRISQVLLA